MAEKGYVYVLTNPSFKENWVKIGKSKREPEVRGKELYNTAVPLPYEIYATLKTEKYHEAEKMIHRSIDRITNLRIAANREFFNIAPEKAFEILSDIKELIGDEAELELKGDNVESSANENGAKRKMSEIFDFYSRGLVDGDKIEFADEPNYSAIVAGSRQVLFEGELWYLSPLARELYTRLGTANKSGAYQGPLHFTFKGIRLTQLDKINSK